MVYLDGKVDGLERLSEVLLLHLAGDVAQVKCGGGRVDILVILAAWFLKPMKARVGIIFCQPSVWLSIFWQL